jgi:hypothetical protein
MAKEKNAICYITGMQQKEYTGRTRTMHLAFALGLFERMDDKTLLECFSGGTPKEIRDEIASLRKQGLEFFPACDNVDSAGKCLGHIKE